MELKLRLTYARWRSTAFNGKDMGEKLRDGVQTAFTGNGKDTGEKLETRVVGA